LLLDTAAADREQPARAGTREHRLIRRR